MPDCPNKESLLEQISGYKGILGLNPSSTAFVPLAEAYRKLGKLEEAEQVALKGTRALPAFSPGFAALGRIQAQRGALEAASASFEKALAIDARSIDALKGEAGVRMLKGEKGHAADLLRRALTLSPADAAAKKILDALQKDSALRKDPAPRKDPDLRSSPPDTRASGSARKEGDDPISTATIAEIYIRQGFLERALQVYRDLSGADPGNEKLREKLLDLQKQIAAQVEEAEVQPESSSERQLAVLGRWLDSIARRRSRVS